MVVRLIFASRETEMMPLLCIYAAAGCILGHNFPITLGFRGGKGIAASVGFLIAFDWRMFVICAVVFFALFFTTHYVSLCSLTSYLTALIAMIVIGETGGYGMDRMHTTEMYLVMAALTVLAFWRHRANIVRLSKGTESKVFLSKSKTNVLGAGSWGTALSLLLHKNGHQVKLWSALENEVKMLNEKREHESKLPGVRIPEEVEITTDLEGCLRDVDVAVLAVPSPFTRSTAKQMAPFVKEGQIIVNVAKGVEEDTLMTLSDIISEEIPAANVCVLSGPSHAEEVGRGLPTTCVVSATKRETAEYLQGIFMSPVFRVYTTPDILGVELGGALKNVIALAAGTADGLGYGDNTKAALITRGIAEIARLGTKMGASQETFYGLSGMGDLIVTCASVHSRNRKAGYLMGKGYTMQQAMDEVKMVVEGVYSAKAARSLAEKYDVDMPIIMEVNKVLFEDKPAADAVRDLMIRDKKVETPMLPW